MLRRPTLSVIMPNYNHAHFLRESLGTILAQSYQPMEIIVIDDASTDDSVKVIEEFARQERSLRLERNKHNMGVDWCVNRLLELAAGDYIYSPSADDTILPGFFEKSISLLAQYPQAGLCSTVGTLIGENGQDRGIRVLPVISGRPCFFTAQELRRKLNRYGRWIDSCSVVYRRDALISVGGYFNELGSFADTFANLILALRYGACYIPEPLVCWRQVANSYASRLAYDWQSLWTIGMFAIKLMRTTYHDLFPTEYINTFEQHWKYIVCLTAMRCARREQDLILTRALETIPSCSPSTNRFFWSGMRLSMRIQNVAWQIYVMMKFAPWRWWIFGRFSIIVNLRKLKIVEHLGK